MNKTEPAWMERARASAAHQREQKLLWDRSRALDAIQLSELVEEAGVDASTIALIARIDEVKRCGTPTDERVASGVRYLLANPDVLVSNDVARGRRLKQRLQSLFPGEYGKDRSATRREQHLMDGLPIDKFRGSSGKDPTALRDERAESVAIARHLSLVGASFE